MVSFRLDTSWRQVKTLTYKNFLNAVIRHPIGFLIKAYIIPIGFLALLLYVPSFAHDPNVYGIGGPRPLPLLADVNREKLLMLVKPPNLGPDADAAIQRITKPLRTGSYRVLDNDRSLLELCVADLRGLSDCFAAISFHDSPLTQGGGLNHTWNYTMWAEPARQGWRYNVFNNDNDIEQIYMPLQVAVENAITDSSINPETMFYTYYDPIQQEKDVRKSRVMLITQIYPFALFTCFIWMAVHMTSLITKERESGMSHLIDAMGGTPTSRVLSYILAFDIAYFPTWIGFGVLYARVLAPDSNAGVLILWQILLGFCVSHSVVFAAAWFKKARASSVYVLLVLLGLSIITQVYSWDPRNASKAGVVALALLFPSSNHLFFLQLVADFQYSEQPIDLNAYLKGSAFDISTSKYAQGGTLLGLMVVGIVFYPVLAIVVEHYMHGISYRGRTFSGGKGVEGSSTAVVETDDLRKRFEPSVTERICCCGRRKSVLAVDGVSLQGHKGQILCLVGPNGSGKTTTLQMMAGLVPSTSGTVRIDALPSQMGICPQNNTFWDDITVEEHVRIWNQIKSGSDDAESLTAMIAACDLEAKTSAQAKTLSGGQKRKLQLACMFVGDSTVCLIDECTSGLDPLSRRVIWEILMAQRAKRSIIFTTHFLDEVEVLADNIVILTKGRVNCHGPATELKNLHGGGYKVLVPRSAPAIPETRQYTATTHQDRTVYATPDSRSAAQLTRAFAAAGITDIAISGPQVEDVFLSVADDPELTASLDHQASAESGAGMELTPGEVTSFWQQLCALLWKRLRVLRRFWWPYVYVLVLPLAIVPNLNKTLEDYGQPNCTAILPDFSWSSDLHVNFYYYPGYYSDTYKLPQAILAPPAANDALHDVMTANFSIAHTFNISLYDKWTQVLPGRDEWLARIRSDPQAVDVGLFMESKTSAPILAFNGQFGVWEGLRAVNLWSQMRSGVEIAAAYGRFAQMRYGADNVGAIYTIAFALVQALYPAAFVIYPAMEKARKVRALEYANGVRRGPLWVAYVLFDSTFILIISIITTAVAAAQIPSWNGDVWVMFPVLMFYGVAAMLGGYVISHFCKSPLAAFMWTASWSLIGYAVVGISFIVGSTYSDISEIDKVNTATTFSINLFFPIGNVFRAFFVGFNINQVSCENGNLRAPSSIYAFGGPILYLIIQIFAFLGLMIWLETARALPRFRKTKTATPAAPISSTEVEKASSGEYAAGGASEEVEKERARVEVAENQDLLRVLHLTKSFGGNVAVDDVTLGLGESDVMALIGPNGAGKSTLVNLIRADLYPDSGSAYLKGEDAYTASAQKHLGVCPQYDALDLLDTREHLAFYARIKGIKDVDRNVRIIMSRLGLTPHATRLASKLSGGNKRKLSLAIALMGTPPVLVLDEPTSAMDAVAKRAFWRIIREIAPNRSLLLTTHSMEEADALANRAAIISSRLLAVGTTQALRKKYSDVSYVQLLLATAPYSTEEEMTGVRAWVQREIPGAKLEREMLGGQVRFTVPGGDAVVQPQQQGQGRSTTATTGARSAGVAGLIELLEEHKEDMGIAYYSIGGATLESVFLSVVKENNVTELDEAPKKRRWWRL